MDQHKSSSIVSEYKPLHPENSVTGLMEIFGNEPVKWAAGPPHPEHKLKET
jgi:hypothetical protein